ncbi:ABC transporter ATP-binding protein [Cohnella endophytica]|uniref:ABC transporter ATP-binding protein n=1 Tax=Cohnella endophytica TaxID=2419778 RepID=A0A494XP23_9BACL|nr:ABC transporter ATP-binding protein [Cohnella endophytica]RKP51552.1 ABC transporter ATP-binding protein [Cohnella endophytica]
MNLLEVGGLTKRFGANAAVDGLSFAISQGRCMALLGPNGAGKTTTLKMLSGLLEPSSGTIRFIGEARADIRESIGYLPQYPSFFNWMSGKEFLEFTAKLARIPAKEAASRAKELLERVGLKDAAKRKISGYSGGMKQRLGLAQAVIHRPKLLILDEPVSALDPQGRREVMELLKEMKRETTILFSTHILHDAEEISDDVMIMDRGHIVVEGDLQQLMRDHGKPQIRIKVGNADPAWVQGLRDRPFVREFEFALGLITLQVTNLHEARESLFREFVDQGLEIEGFEMGQTTLEDLFMKAVQA